MSNEERPQVRPPGCAEVDVLDVIDARLGAASTPAIAMDMGWSQATARRFLRRMERNGFVRAHDGSGSRGKVIFWSRP